MWQWQNEKHRSQYTVGFYECDCTGKDGKELPSEICR